MRLPWGLPFRLPIAAVGRKRRGCVCNTTELTPQKKRSYSPEFGAFAVQMSWVVFQVPSGCFSRMLMYFDVDVTDASPFFGVKVTSAMPRPYARLPDTSTFT